MPGEAWGVSGAIGGRLEASQVHLHSEPQAHIRVNMLFTSDRAFSNTYRITLRFREKSRESRFAEPDLNPRSDPQLVNAALTWKFIPAFKDGRPVASRLRIAVSPRQ